jgi:hypothetical protein
VFQNATITASVPSASETVEGIIEIATNAEATAATATDKALVPSNLSSINVSTLNNDAGYLTDITGENIGDLADVTVTTPSAGEALVYNGTLSVFENATVSASVAALNDIGDVDTTGVTSSALLQYDGANWVDGPLVGTSANNVVQLDGSAQLPAVDGSQLLNLPSAIDRFKTTVTASGTLPAINDNRRQHYDVTVAGLTVTIPNGGSSDVTGGIISVRNASSGNITYSGPATSWADGTQSGSKTLRPYQTGVLVWTSQYTTSEISNLYGTAAAEDVGTAASNVVQLDGSARLPAVDGSQLINLPSATVAALDDIGDVDTTGVANTNTLKYNSTSGNWEAGAVAASEVSGLAPTVTLSSPSSSPLNLSTPSAGVIEEAYILSPTVDITVNLVSATTLGSGFKYHFKNRSANVITLDAASAQTIDGSFTFVVSAQESSVTLVTNGSNWFII